MSYIQHFFRLKGHVLLFCVLTGLFLPGCLKINQEVKCPGAATAEEGDNGAGGCLTRAVRSGDKAADGTACTSGLVCKTPGVTCDIANPLAKCKTVNTGGGACACTCQ
jgi:hypothetical protein